MSFEFLLNLDCPVKQAIPSEELVGLVKARNQARAILEIARGRGDARPASEIRITRRLQTPEGTRDTSVSIQEMLDDAARLEGYEGHCQGCAANVRGRPFGCYATVSYPIRQGTEAWLMGLLPASREGTAGTMLLKAIGDLGYDGRPIAALRSRPNFFEAKAPARRKWGSFFTKAEVTSDQVLQMLFCVGTMQPSHALMCALFLGAIPHDIPVEGFEAALQDRKARLALLNRANIPADTGDDQVWDMIVFLDALVRAAAFELTLSTSY